jgi:glycine/D-amino acid oxidase-like deaminating enzyme
MAKQVASGSTAEIVIIGGGIMGCALAFDLTAPGTSEMLGGSITSGKIDPMLAPIDPGRFA